MRKHVRQEDRAKHGETLVSIIKDNPNYAVSIQQATDIGFYMGVKFPYSCVTYSLKKGLLQEPLSGSAVIERFNQTKTSTRSKERAPVSERITILVTNSTKTTLINSARKANKTVPVFISDMLNKMSDDVILTIRDNERIKRLEADLERLKAQAKEEVVIDF